jgi:hypothetical protein
MVEDKSRYIKWLLAILLTAIVGISALKAGTQRPPIEKATEKFPFSGELRLKIRKTFYKDFKISQKKIATYRNGILERLRQIEKNLEKVYRQLEGKSKKKAIKKIKDQGDVESYKILLKYIDRMSRTTDPVKFESLAYKVLDLDFALKMHGRRLQTGMMLQRLSESLKSRKIPIYNAPYGEAYNLQDPSNGLYYSQAQLARMKSRGVDISKFNPPTDSTFWQPHDIPALDLRTYYQKGRDPLHRGLKIAFPTDTVYYDEVRRTQTKPKIDVFFRDPRTGKKIKLKLKVGAEMHSEITASALYTALGFSVDISRYVRDIKLVLGDVTPQQFRVDWNTYYSRFNVDRYIKEEGKDENGHYIILHEGLLEAKPRGLQRVGRWSYGRNGHSGLREVRGTLVFDMWITNIDLHDSENNKLVLRKIKTPGDKKENKKDPEYRFHHLQHDMGFAFGWAYIERPGEFKWDILKRKTDSHVYLNYRSFQVNPSFKHITYADGRWITRLIAQLSRKQIRDAVEMGGWPDGMGKLLVEKLISRRNQLVKAFDLEGEILPNGKTIEQIPFNRHVTTGDGQIVKGKLKKYIIPGYTQYFGPRFQELIGLIVVSLRNIAVDASVGAVGSMRYIDLSPEEILGYKTELVTRVVLRMNREIEPNPFPTGLDDHYLVKDMLRIGFRIGYGFIFSGDLTYYRQYTVVYPVKNRNEGRFHNNFILNVFLKPQVKRYAELTTQQRFAVMIEDSLEGRLRFKLTNHENTVEGGTLGFSKIFLKRNYISRKAPERLVFFEDQSRHKQWSLKVYLEFGEFLRFRIPFYRSTRQNGFLVREYREMDLTDLEENSEKTNALERLLIDNDTGQIKKFGKGKHIDDKFFERKTKFSLFGFIKRRTIFRKDRWTQKLIQRNNNDSGDSVDSGKSGEDENMVFYQVESSKHRSWRFLDNGEKHKSTIRMTGKTGDDKKIDAAKLTIDMRITDKNTTDKELKRSYLNLINTIARDNEFIDFDSPVFTVNKHWGETQLHLEMHLYKKALDTLMKVSDAEVWNALSTVTKKPVERLIELAKLPDYRMKPPKINSCKLAHLARKTHEFLRYLRKARKTKNVRSRIAHQVKAVRKAVYTSGQSFNPALLAAIHQIVGKENVFLRAYITMPENKENIFPEREPLYAESGTRRPVESIAVRYIMDDAGEIYHLFEK